MGIFDGIKKAVAGYGQVSKMFQLQRKVVSLTPTLDYSSDKAVRATLEQGERQKKAVEEYIKFCLTLPAIPEVMSEFNATETDLLEVYGSLVRSGLGMGDQFIRGQYIPLACISCCESLYFILEAKSRGIHPPKIAATLLAYWEKKIPNGGLFDMIKKANTAKKPVAG